MDALFRSHDRLLDICNRLESIADSLPGQVDAAACAALAEELPRALAEAHEQEEQLLLPRLAISILPELRKLAARLRREHSLDQANALEIQETLLSLARGKPALAGDATGYQLRAFFEGMRRHIGAEQDILALLGHFPRPIGA